MIIKVAIAGALGKMGQACVKAVIEAPDMQLVAAIGRHGPAGGEAEDVGTLLGYGKPVGIKVSTNWTEALANADVCIEFTHPDGVFDHANRIINVGVRPVIGTTGLSSEQLKHLDAQLSQKQLGGLVVPNFSIGAVLMMRFAEQAAKYFSNAEIMEIHHNRKADAPSGTAIKTAQMMARQQVEGFGRDNAPETELIAGARGAEADGHIRIHSVRLPGMVAHQEVMLSGPGQLLTIRHDSFDRACYMPGVLLAVRYAMSSQGLTYGLETLL